jgi:PLP dependent protein
VLCLAADGKDMLKDRLEGILSRIERAALHCGRDPGNIRLVAVGKTQPVRVIRQAIESGARIIGENYVQEARDKFEALIGLPVQWHFIGHLQSNKAKYAVRLFDLIHTVDSLKLASELDRQAHKSGKIQNILVQVNISGEATKSGISPEEAAPFLKKIGALQNLRVRGLMCLPPFFDAPQKARPYFAELRMLSQRLGEQDLANIALDELSMGMTGDFEVAVEEGATLVRIGTAIFGDRQ